MILSPFQTDQRGGYHYWCPGCGTIHGINTMGVAGIPVWTFDGNMDSPTFNPSVRIFITNKDGSQTTLCHHWIKAGQIQFLADCEHALAGKTVPMAVFPINSEEAL